MSEASEILGDREFVVADVVAIDPPSGESGKWFRYSIVNASAPISGIRAGSLKSQSAGAAGVLCLRGAPAAEKINRFRKFVIAGVSSAARAAAWSAASFYGFQSVSFFLDPDHGAVDFTVVQVGDRNFRFVTFHFHAGESAAFAGEHVANEAQRMHRAKFVKQFL